MQTKPKVNILLVDDNPKNLLALEGILECLEHNLVKVTSGKEALKYLMQMDFAVILLDVHMPDMDGFETAEIIRTRQQNQHTPIIFLTAISKSEMFVFKGYSVGAVDYLVKPIVPEILISKVAVFIELFQKTVEIKQQAQQLVAINKILENKIKEHEKTEELLQIKEGEFAAIIRSIPDAIIFVNCAGVITMVNPAVKTIFGYEPEEIIGKNYFLLFNFLENYVIKNNKLLAHSHFQPLTVAFNHQNGQGLIGEVNHTVVQNREGNLIGFLHIIRDITLTRQAEETMARLNHQNELILNSAGEGIYGINREGKTTFINPAAAKLLGYKVEELIAQPMHQLLLHTKIDGTSYHFEESPVYKSLQDGTIHHITNEVFWRKDGSYFSVEYLSTPIIELNEIVGAVITFKDITERYALERIKDEFISVVSHELRTPLTLIQGALSLLMSNKLDPQSTKGKRMLGIAAEGSERLVRLVNDILDLERLESGKITIVKQPCNAADLMIKAIDLLQIMANDAEVKLLVYPQSIELNVDSDRIIQVLTNLVSNAIKFSPKGATVELSVELLQKQIGCYTGIETQRYILSTSPCLISSTSLSPPISLPSAFSAVLFKIKDQGRGIPAEKIESIFERFHQVDTTDSRKKGGTGLGLAICRSIVQQHGGQIWVESLESKGSTFYFTLPWQTIEDSNEP